MVGLEKQILYVCPSLVGGELTNSRKTVHRRLHSFCSPGGCCDGNFVSSQRSCVLGLLTSWSAPGYNSFIFLPTLFTSVFPKFFLCDICFDLLTDTVIVLKGEVAG